MLDLEASPEYDFGDLRSDFGVSYGRHDGCIGDCLIYTLNIHQNWIGDPRDHINQTTVPKKGVII